MMLLLFIFMLMSSMMLVFPVTIYCCLYLVMTVSSVVGVLVWFNIISSFLPILLIMIYIGAMMVMIGYICAVVPNMVLYNVNPTFIFLFFIVLVASCFISEVFSFYDLNVSKSSVVIMNYFYTYSGSWVFGLLVILMLLALLMMSSSFYNKSPMRGV